MARRTNATPVGKPGGYNSRTSGRDQDEPKNSEFVDTKKKLSKGPAAQKKGRLKRGGFAGLG